MMSSTSRAIRRRTFNAEIGSDYVKMPIHEIEKTFMD